MKPSARRVPIEVIKADGTRFQHEAGYMTLFQDIYPLIGCDTIELVRLDDGRCLLVDEDGIGAEKPINAIASEMADRPIVGDVAVCALRDVR